MALDAVAAIISHTFKVFKHTVFVVDTFSRDC